VKLDDEKSIAYTPENLKTVKDMLAESEIKAICVTGDVLTEIAMVAVRNKLSKVEQAAGGGGDSTTTPFIDPKTVLLHPDAQATLQSLVPLMTVFARHAPRQKEAVIAAFNAAGRVTLMCGDGTNDVGALKMSHIGISIISVPDVEAKQREVMEEIEMERKERKREKKNQLLADSDKKKKKALKTRRKKKSIEQQLQVLAEAEEEVYNVALGDASVASPFTSRTTSIKCVKDIIQRGRCTLVTMIQIYKILGVNCLVNALTLSSLYLVGAKQGDRQLTAVGVVVAGLFFFVTKGQPLKKLSPQRPPITVLSKEAMTSLALQFLIHFVFIMIVTAVSLTYLDPYDPSLIPDGNFNPNILNTSTFLMTVLATVNTFVVNYQGEPFIEDLKKNKLLIKSLQASVGIVFACALEIFPPLNDLLQLSPLPSELTTRAVTSVHLNNLIGDSWEEFHQFVSMLRSIDFKTLLCVLMVLDCGISLLAEQMVRKFFRSMQMRSLKNSQ